MLNYRIMADEFTEVLRRIFADIEVELTDEFDNNFTRQAFFTEKWARRKSPVNQDKGILAGKGKLRKSIRVSRKGNKLTFSSNLPYAAIHNDGGVIKVTQRMKRYFMARYLKARGSMGYRKNGTLRNNRRNARLSAEAEFFKAMALMKVGKEIKMPRRRFMGNSPEVEAAIREIVAENLMEYFRSIEFK